MKIRALLCFGPCHGARYTIDAAAKTIVFPQIATDGFSQVRYRRDVALAPGVYAYVLEDEAPARWAAKFGT